MIQKRFYLFLLKISIKMQVLEAYKPFEVQRDFKKQGEYQLLKRSSC